MESEVITSRKIIYPGDIIGIIGEGRSSVQLVATAKSMGFKVATYVTSEKNGVNQYADISFVGSIHDGEKLRWPEAKAFLLKLSEIFNWAIYESDFVKSKQDKETQDKVIEDDAKIALLWMSGYSLQRICDFAIQIRDPERGDTRFLNRVRQYHENTPNIDWETITINLVMKRLQNLQFVLGKYFLKVTQELTKSGMPPQNDWYRFMEYGTDSDLRIWLQQNGYSRESSEYIEDNKDEFIIQTDNNYFVSKNILKANDLDAVSETKEIEINVPEIFI